MSRRWLVLGFIFAGIVISYIDRGNLGIAAPAMMADFHFTPSQMGTLLSAFFWTYALFQIPAGTIVDRVGIRLVYAGAFLVWSLASAAIGLSRDLTEILILRMVLGMAESVGPIASLSFIRRSFTGQEAGLPIAIYIAGQNLGPATGALVGSQLIVHQGWRMMFIITGLVALAWLPGWLWFAPRTDGRTEGPAIRSEAAVIPWGEVLGSSAFWAMTLVSFLAAYFWFFLLTWIPTYLISTRGFSTQDMGKVLSTPLFCMAAVNIAAGWVADRVVGKTGSVFRVRVGFCAIAYLCSGALLLLLVFPSQTAVLPVLIVAICSAGIGNSNYWTLAQHTAPSHLVGRAIGYLNTVAQIAGAAAPLITGWILGPEKQFGVALAIAGITGPIAAVCMLSTGPGGLDRMRSSLAGGLA